MDGYTLELIAENDALRAMQVNAFTQKLLDRFNFNDLDGGVDDRHERRAAREFDEDYNHDRLQEERRGF